MASACSAGGADIHPDLAERTGHEPLDVAVDDDVARAQRAAEVEPVERFMAGALRELGADVGASGATG